MNLSVTQTFHHYTGDDGVQPGPAPGRLGQVARPAPAQQIPSLWDQAAGNAGGKGAASHRRTAGIVRAGRAMAGASGGEEGGSGSWQDLRTQRGDGPRGTVVSRRGPV